MLALTALAARRQRRSDWDGARRIWSAAARVAGKDDAELIARCRIEMAICECFLGSFEAAARNVRHAERLWARVGEWPETLLVQARLARRRDAGEALDFLFASLRVSPDDTAVLYEIGSVLVDGPSPSRGVPYAERLVALEPGNASFRMLAADLAERSGRWTAAGIHLGHLVELDPGSRDAHRRLIQTLAAAGDLEGARRAALTALRALDRDLMALHWLFEAYRKAGDTDGAAKLGRIILRRWPHSHWHRLQYAELLANGGQLNAADGVLAAYTGSWEEHGYARALFEVAKRAGARTEALVRAGHLRSLVPFDLDLEVEHGYAVADVEGPARGRSIFHELSIRTRFHPRALHGMAHMAVRERDGAATLEAWRRASEVHPDDAYATSEYCRSLFDTGHGEAAIRACEAALPRFTKNRAFVEFHVWLSTAVGRFERTLAFCAEHLPDLPNSWQLLESGFVCAGYRKSSAAFAARALDPPFTVAHDDDVQRLYTVMRVASLTGHEDLLRGRFLVGPQSLQIHPWLAPLAVPDRSGPRPEPAPAAPQGIGNRLTEGLYRSSRFAAAVETGRAAAFEAMTEAEINAMLDEPGREARTIHIFSKFEQARGGSELHALDLAGRLRGHATVELWAPAPCHHSFVESGAVRVVDPWTGQIPSEGGIVVLVGLYFDLGPWLGRIKPHRMLALYNTFEAPSAVRRLERLFGWSGRRTELIYCSRLMRTEMGLPGVFEPSPTDLDLFAPAGTDHLGRPFTIGRHSRDVVEKHHPEDGRVYGAVAGLGGRSIVLGGLSMRETFGPVSRLDLRPAASHGIPDFLRTLDCYFYRTGTWVEPWGRVVIEALACGLPVVAHRVGGYAEAIQHSVNGFLFDETDEAIEQVTRLMRDPDLKRWMSGRARESAATLVGTAAMRRLAAFYLFERK